MLAATRRYLDRSNQMCLAQATKSKYPSTCCSEINNKFLDLISFEKCRDMFLWTGDSIIVVKVSRWWCHEERSIEL